jgi:hypothetical protein
MFKLSSHDPFGYLKHKLWPKQRSRVKLTIWFLTTKSRKSPECTYVQVACHISLEICQRGLQLCFKSHLNQRFEQKVMGLQNCENLNFKNFETPKLGVSGQNDFWVLALWLSTENTIRGRWWLPPSLSHDESCESMFARGLSVHEKCFNYTLTNLLFGLCKFMWIIDLLITHHNPHPRAPTRPSTLEVLWVRKCTPTPCPFIVFTLDL